MTIDEAIAHCEKTAIEKETQAEFYKTYLPDEVSKLIAITECAHDYSQLAEWLKELKSYIDRDTAEPVHYYDRMSRAECPSCGHKMYDDDATWKCDYCCNCGKKLRW